MDAVVAYVPGTRRGEGVGELPNAWRLEAQDGHPPEPGIHGAVLTRCLIQVSVM